jgi:hypothetical protein
MTNCALNRECAPPSAWRPHGDLPGPCRACLRCTSRHPRPRCHGRNATSAGMRLDVSSNDESAPLFVAPAPGSPPPRNTIRLVVLDGGSLASFASVVAAEMAGGPGGAAMDANVLIRGLDDGELDAVDKALGGRIPNVSPTAVEEHVGRGEARARLNISSARRVRRSRRDFRRSGGASARVLGPKDALIASSAMQEGIPLITGDQPLLRFLGEIGYPAEGF